MRRKPIEHADARGGGTSSGRRGEDGHAEEKGAVAAVTVGEASEEDQQRGVDDGVPIEHPGQLAQVRGLQISGDLRQGHVDDEEVEAGQDHSGASDDEHLTGSCLGPGGGGSGALYPLSEFRHTTHHRGLRSIMQPTNLEPMDARASRTRRHDDARTADRLHYLTRRLRGG